MNLTERNLGIQFSRELGEGGEEGSESRRAYLSTTSTKRGRGSAVEVLYSVSIPEANDMQGDRVTFERLREGRYQKMYANKVKKAKDRIQKRAAYVCAIKLCRDTTKKTSQEIAA